jgi:ABC-type branched-subunit amino acid transport system substrate-binding protein
MFAMVGLLTGITACGTDADDAGSETGGGGSSEGSTAEGEGDSTGVTDTEILFGMATPLSGNASSLGIDGQKGAEVFIKWINDQGGTNGRQWRLVTQDDGFDPQKKITAVRYLIEEEDVFAVWGDVGSGAVAALPVFEETGVPYLFPYALAPDMYEPTKPNVFTIVPASSLQEEANGNWIAENYPGHAEDDPKFGMLTLNSPDGADAVKGFKASAAGEWVVAEQQFERTTTSWKPQLEALKSAGVTDVMLHASDAWTAKMLAEAQEIGFDATFYASTGAVTLLIFDLAGDDVVEGTHAVSILAAANDTEVPGVQEFLDAFAEYEPGYQPGTFALHSWVGGLAIAEALNQIEGTPTREALMESLESIEDFSTDGITGNLTFTEEQHLGTDQVLIVEAEGGQWTPVSDWIDP